MRPNPKKDRSARRTRGNYEPPWGLRKKKYRNRSKYRPTPGYIRAE